MEIACQGAPDPTIGHQKELSANKGLSETVSEKQSSVCKVEDSEKVAFHSQWKILKDVITKGTAKEETEGGSASISIIAQAECELNSFLLRGVGSAVGYFTSFASLESWVHICLCDCRQGEFGDRFPVPI